MVQSFLTVSTDARGGETLRIPFTAVIRKLSQGMPMAMPPRAPTSIGAPSAPVKNVLPAGKH
jgi:hypothetical protein